MAEKDLEVMARSCDEPEEFPIKSLNNVLEQVYADHTNDGPVHYTLDAAACDAFFKFSKPQDNAVSPSQASVGSPCPIRMSSRIASTQRETNTPFVCHCQCTFFMIVFKRHLLVRLDQQVES
jgi:hypothetical protein